MGTADYSHTGFQQMKISSDNSALCKKLLEISSKPAPATAGRAGPLPLAPASAAAINRRWVCPEVVDP